jgi:soluble lytic murein transglycosylase
LQTSDADVALVKTALDCLRSGGTAEATRIEATISDPAARELVEWIILRNRRHDVEGAHHSRLVGAKSSSPSLTAFHLRAEATHLGESTRSAPDRGFVDGTQLPSAADHVIPGLIANAAQAFAAVPTATHESSSHVLARVELLRQQDKIAEAAQAVLSVPQDLAQHYDPEAWWVERRLLARRLLDIGDAPSAYLIVQAAAEPIEEGRRVERHFMAGWIALRFLDDPDAAVVHFAHIPAVSTQSTALARCHYWLARAAEAAGRGDQARAEYEAAAGFSDAYYGQLARARLGLGALALAAPPEGPASKLNPELARALEILYALNERSLVVSLMTEIGGKVDAIDALLEVGEVAEGHQDARAMLEMGSIAVARGFPLYPYAFPTVGVPSYSPVGPGIDRAVLLAVIRQESAFNPEDLSSAGAIGLMQVTPAAGQDTCRLFGCAFDLDRLKTDAAYNLQLGAAELGGLLREYRGNYIMAFAAYNAGRGRVAQWIDRFGDPRDSKVDPIDWVERIPITETRNYVQRVMENLQVYRSRIDRNAPLTIARDLRGAPLN